MGLIQSVGDLNRTKTLPPPSKTEFCQLTAFGLELQLFPGSPVCCPILQILNSPRFHGHVSQSLKVPLSLSLSLSLSGACVCVCIVQVYLVLLHFILLHFTNIPLFTNWGFVTTLHWGKSTGTIFLTPFAYFMSLCHILLILAIFQIFSLLLSLLWWPVISDLWCYCCSYLGAPWNLPTWDGELNKCGHSDCSIYQPFPHLSPSPWASFSETHKFFFLISYFKF